MRPYAHGGNVDAFALAHGFAADEVIDFSANINFIRPDAATDFGEVALGRYPEPTYRRLRELLATRYGVPSAEQMELFNGASSAIFSLFRFAKSRRCALYAPIYPEYKKAAELFGYETDLIDRFNTMDAEVAEGSLVVFVNPATPDGTLYDMEALLEQWSAKGCTVLADESFLDFTDGESAVTYLQRYDNLFILKSMTKFYAGAGVRIGVVIADEKQIARLREREPAWKLSALDSAYMERVLKEGDFAETTRQATAENREMLKTVLEHSGLFDRVYPSAANFILARLAEGDAEALQVRLAPFKIMVRNCENFDFLDGRYVRFAVKEREAIEALKRALTPSGTKSRKPTLAAEALKLASDEAEDISKTDNNRDLL